MIVDANAITSVQRFNCAMINDTIYHSKRYSRTTCRKNTVCCYLTDDDSITYGTIVAFCLAAQQTQPFCFIEKLDKVNDFSPLLNIRPSRNRDIRILNAQYFISRQFLHTTSFQNEVTQAIPICRIIKKCVFICVPCRSSPSTTQQHADHDIQTGYVIFNHEATKATHNKCYVDQSFTYI